MKVGFVGLGAMGMGMAKNLLNHSHQVIGFDIVEEARLNLEKMGGIAAHSLDDLTSDIDALIMMVIDSDQINSILFDQQLIKKLAPDTVVIICSTIEPSKAREIGLSLIEHNLLTLDAPVSGGKTGADAGSLSIMASGSEAAFTKAEPIFDAIADKVYHLGSEPGQGSTYKIVHQLAAGIHLAAMGEVMALGVRAGCDAKTLYDVIDNSAGKSWIFSDRVPYLLNDDYAPRSAIDIFLKDMNLVLDTAKQVRMPLPLASIAQQLFVAASSSGYGKLNDAAIVKVYEDLTGVNVAKGISGL